MFSVYLEITKEIHQGTRVYRHPCSTFLYYLCGLPWFLEKKYEIRRFNVIVNLIWSFITFTGGSVHRSQEDATCCHRLIKSSNKHIELHIENNQFYSVIHKIRVNCAIQRSGYYPGRPWGFYWFFLNLRSKLYASMRAF